MFAGAAIGRNRELFHDRKAKPPAGSGPCFFATSLTGRTGIAGTGLLAVSPVLGYGDRRFTS